MGLKLLIEHHLEFLSLKGGCTGSSVSTLVKILHCWKSHVTAQLRCSFSGVVHFLESKIVNIFLPSSLNICFGSSKEPSH